MISVNCKGKWDKVTKYLSKIRRSISADILDKYGQIGVAALASVTPVETGLTANSWYYEVVIEKGSAAIRFCNSNIQNGVPIAVILQYGHGTRNGGWVVGRDYINPAIQPVFDDITKQAWREVTKL